MPNKGLQTKMKGKCSICRKSAVGWFDTKKYCVRCLRLLKEGVTVKEIKEWLII